MSTVTAVIALVLALLVSVGCVVLLGRVQAMRRTALALQAKVDALVPGAPLPPDLVASLGSGPRKVLVVEILNPIQLATSRTRAASLLAAVRPSLLTKVVYEQASKNVVGRLEEEGVLADVQVHAAR